MNAWIVRPVLMMWAVSLVLLAAARVEAQCTSAGNQWTCTNATAITIPASGTGSPTGSPAGPYPSNITVAGIPGTMAKVTVTINRFTHTLPRDVDMLLVGPNGQVIVLWSDAGGSGRTLDRTVTLDDAAAQSLPTGNPTGIVSGTYKPTDYNGTFDPFPAPAPAHSVLNEAAPAGSATLAAKFNGSSPNGTWSLYVVDDQGADVGSIAGWSLTIDVVTACPCLTLNRTTARYGGIISGSATSGPAAQTLIGTSAQTFTVNQSGAGTVPWTATASHPWMTVTPASGTGTSSFTVAINSTGLPASGTVTGTVTITAPAAGNAPLVLTVTVVVYPSTASTSAPVGSWDTPAANASGIAGSLAVTGWALDDTEVSGIRIFRATFGAEPAGQQIFLGDALFVAGARPDVETANPTLPFNYRGGWGYQLLTNMLPGGGNGTYTLFVYADDRDGKTTLLGTRTVTIANSTSIKPFGAIDAPAPGATISGTAFAHYGWALTPNPKMIPLDGSTITVFIDGVLVGPVTYNQPRGDIAGLFPGLTNTNGSLGTRTIDTTTFANGVHTIAWNVFDSAGIGEGLGSRYFAIQNGSAVVAGGLTTAPPSLGSLRALHATHTPDGARLSSQRIRVARGYLEEASAEIVDADTRGVRHVVAREQDRLVLQLWDQHPGDGTFAGYLAVGDELRPLPIGSTLDERAGVFSWAPGPGFVGRYDLVFVRTDRDGWREQIPVQVTLGPRS